MNTDTKELVKKVFGNYALMIRKAHGHWAFSDGELEQFVNMIRSDEREACAKVVENKWKVFEELKAAHYRQTSEPFDPFRYHKDLGAIFMSRDLAAAIRARGNE